MSTWHDQTEFLYQGERKSLHLVEEGQSGKDNVVILNRRPWDRGLASDRQSIHRQIRTDGAPVTLVGVLSEGVDDHTTVMCWSPLSRTFDELLATTRTLLWRVPLLAGNTRVRSGDLLSRGALRQPGVRVQQVHGIPQPFDVNHLA
jgi:hypothetical protein